MLECWKAPSPKISCARRHRNCEVGDHSVALQACALQDAAYESLLKSRRQVLHRRIAETLQEKFADAVEAEPELLAHTGRRSFRCSHRRRHSKPKPSSSARWSRSKRRPWGMIVTENWIPFENSYDAAFDRRHPRSAERHTSRPARRRPRAGPRWLADEAWVDPPVEPIAGSSGSSDGNRKRTSGCFVNPFRFGLRPRFAPTEHP